MNITAKKILFVSHDATLTGAPILLLNLIKLLKKNGYGNFKIVIRYKRGVLISEFEQLGEVAFWERGKSKTGFYTRFKDTFSDSLNKYKIRTILRQTDIVFSNTATNGELLDFIKKINSKIPVISYIHELELGFRQFVPTASLNLLIKNTDVFVAPSHAVQQFLARLLNTSLEHIQTLNYYIPGKNGELLELSKENVEIRQQFIIGACGTTDWRKGPDLFLGTAKAFFTKYPVSNVSFVWKGGNKKQLDTQRFLYEVEKAGLSKRISYQEASGDMSNFFEKIDVFLLSSKEDPYPLVVLEAGAHRKPSICFEGSGGAVEFVSNDCGYIVPFFDFEYASERIKELVDNPVKTKELGRNAFEKLKNKHQDGEAILRTFSKLLNYALV